MALEAVVYPHDLFNYGCKDLYSMGGGGGGGGGWSYDLGVKEEERMGCSGGGGGESLEKNIEEGPHLIGYGDSSSSSIMLQNVKELDTNSSADGCTKSSVNIEGASTTTSGSGRRKRRRTKSCKNKEEVENQRMTHIVVERNRRKQMNEYLSVLRSLMPPSYVQRSDQASIVGGAINFVKELEQLLQSLEAQKRTKHQSDSSFSSPFAEFFTSPQYPSCSTHSNNSATMNESVGENRSLIADIKVTMVESHANLKVLTKRHPKQLWKMVAGFQGLRLTILHLNVTTVDDMVLYSFSIKIEDECQLTTVDEIATAVHEMLDRIQVEVGVL